MPINLKVGAPSLTQSLKYLNTFLHGIFWGQWGNKVRPRLPPYAKVILFSFQPCVLHVLKFSLKVIHMWLLLQSMVGVFSINLTGPLPLLYNTPAVSVDLRNLPWLPG